MSIKVRDKSTRHEEPVQIISAPPCKNCVNYECDMKSFPCKECWKGFERNDFIYFKKRND